MKTWIELELVNLEWKLMEIGWFVIGDWEIEENNEKLVRHVKKREVVWSSAGYKRILSKDQILVSCSHMTCYIQKLHYISIYIFIDVFIQGMIKNPKINIIH